MARRKLTQPDDGDTATIPEHLRRFNPDDWPVTGEPPPHWPPDRESVGLWSGIAAHQQWLDARGVWEAETGLSIHTLWDERLRTARLRARTLADLNAPYHPDVFVDPADPDPRWSD